VVEAYILAYTEANGCAPPMGAADNTAAKRLVDQMGAGAAVEFIHDVFANDRVRQRYPSIRRLASDPAAVRAELTAVDEAHEITDQELEQAQALARANPDHPVVRTLRAQAERAGLKKVVPSRRQFEWLVSQPDAGRRNKQHAPQQDASFEVHPAWREG
jgi:hypothetical protein